MKRLEMELMAIKIRELNSKGLSRKLIAEELGISKDQVKYVSEKFDIKAFTYKNDIDYEKIKELLKDRKSIKDIAKILNIKPGYLTAILLEKGIDHKTIDTEKLIELYNSGLSQQKIAEQLGICRATESRYEKILGLTRKTPEEIVISKEEIVKHLNDGLPCNKIGKIYGCTNATIIKKAVKYGLHTVKRYRTE